MTLFHLGYTEKIQKSVICASDIPELTAENYLVYSQEKKQLKAIGKSEPISIELEKNAYECLLFLPVKEDVPFIPVGLMDKYMSFHAMKETEWLPDRKWFRVRLADGGVFGFAAKKETGIVKVLVNGQDCTADLKLKKEVANACPWYYYEVVLQGMGLQRIEIQYDGLEGEYGGS
jgi:hypothetical protein